MLRKILTVVCLVAFGAATFAGCTPPTAKDQPTAQPQAASPKAGKTLKDKGKRKKAPPHVTTAK